MLSSSILSVYLTALRIIEALNEADDSGLAAARLPNQSQAASWVHLQTELTEDLHLRAGRVPEAHIAQLHTAPSLLWLSTCSTSGNRDERWLTYWVDGNRQTLQYFDDCYDNTRLYTEWHTLVWYVNR